MAYSTTDSVTSTVTFDEYTHPIQRVLTVLRHLAALSGQATLQVTNRELADLAQCSAGSMPSILRRLEADGHIERIADPQQGTLIALLGPAALATPRRSVPDREPNHDRHADRPDPPIPHGDAGSNVDRSQCRDQKIIPPCTPLYGTHETLDQEEESRASESAILARLMAEPGMNRALAARIAAAPLGSLAEFERDVQIAETFARNPLYLTVARWRDGQRVTAPQEPPHASRQRPTAPHQRGRSRAYPSAPTPAQRTADDAFLAEVAALNPGRLQL